MRAGFGSKTIFAILKKWDVDDETLTELENETPEAGVSSNRVPEFQNPHGSYRTTFRFLWNPGTLKLEPGLLA